MTSEPGRKLTKKETVSLRPHAQRVAQTADSERFIARSEAPRNRAPALDSSFSRPRKRLRKPTILSGSLFRISSIEPHKPYHQNSQLTPDR